MPEFNIHSVIDFTRCQRADGSHYGTGGQCRKGREVDPLSEALKGGKLIGEGGYGEVYDVGNGIVVKVGAVNRNEVKAHRVLKHVQGGT